MIELVYRKEKDLYIERHLVYKTYIFLGTDTAPFFFAFILGEDVMASITEDEHVFYYIYY